MQNTSTTQLMLSPREELEIGLMVCDKLKDLLFSGKLSPSEVRSELREVVQKVGVGYTDEDLVQMTVSRLLHDLAGRF